MGEFLREIDSLLRVVDDVEQTARGAVRHVFEGVPDVRRVWVDLSGPAVLSDESHEELVGVRDVRRVASVQRSNGILSERRLDLHLCLFAALVPVHFLKTREILTHSVLGDV